jgi:hypothetical protein
MKPRSVRGFDWIEEPTESSEEMPLMRRRPLARAAMVGGTAYVAGKHHAQSHAREADQEAQIQEGAEAGAMAGAEAMADGQVFDDDNVSYAADAIPNGTAAGVALIEHRWAIPLRDAIARAGGIPLVDEWIHVTDLIAVGVAAAEDVPA